MTAFYTFKKKVKLKSGQVVGYLKGHGYYAKKKGAPAPKAPALPPLTPHQKLVQKALTQLGQQESPPNSNRSKYSLWYGMIGPWCAMFVSWVCDGIFAFKFSYVPAVLEAARTGQHGLRVISTPVDGCFPCYDWPGESPGTPDHIGIYASEALLERLAPVALHNSITIFGPLGPGDFWAIEGNTAPTNNSNGGEVWLRKRNHSNVEAFVLVS